MATREDQRIYQREWRARRKRDFFEGKTCAACGSADGLVLDHIDRTQKVDHKVWSWSAVRREAELAKCQVLCGECHREKTNEEIRALYAAKPPPDHGTDARYGRGCRCERCRSAHSSRMRTPTQRGHVRASTLRRKEREASNGG